MRYIRIILLIVCVFSLIASVVSSASAFTQESCLLYDGRQKDFAFVNINDGDLFSNFKNVMPGDVLSQKIVVKVQNIDNKVDLYLQTGEGEGVLPSGAKISIYNGSNLLYDSSSPSNSFKNSFLLGSFDQDGSLELLVVLSVPVEAGNEVAGLEESINWVFTIQDSGDTYIPEVPKTGDSSRLFISIAIAGISLIGIILVLKSLKEENEVRVCRFP